MIAEEIDPFEPDWSKAPFWAMWHVVSAKKTAHWFEAQPGREDYGWMAIEGRVAEDRETRPNSRYWQLPPGIDWRSSLRKRPDMRGVTP